MAFLVGPWCQPNIGELASYVCFFSCTVSFTVAIFEVQSLVMMVLNSGSVKGFLGVFSLKWIRCLLTMKPYRSRTPSHKLWRCGCSHGVKSWWFHPESVAVRTKWRLLLGRFTTMFNSASCGEQSRMNTERPSKGPKWRVGCAQGIPGWRLFWCTMSWVILTMALMHVGKPPTRWKRFLSPAVFCIDLEDYKIPPLANNGSQSVCCWPALT